MASVSNAQVIITRTYTYAPTHLGVVRVVETTSDGTTRTTETAYAHEQSASSAMKAKNMLSQVYAVTVLDGSSDVEFKTWTTWKTFAAAGGAWLPSEAWAWRGAGDGTTNDTTAPTTPSASNAETFRTAAVTAVDAYGRPTAITDARGASTAFEYGPSNAGPAVTKVAAPLVGATSYGYDAVGRLTTTTDPNGAVTTYRYDGLSRLTGVRLPETPTTAWTTTYAYAYGTAGAPNAVTRRDYASASVYAETVAFTDGLGRPVQTQVKEGAGYVVQATTYDGLGRVSRQYAPYRRTASSAAFDAAFDANARAYYDGTPGPNANGRPFVETTYLADPTGRVAATAGEGNALTVAVTAAYGTAVSDGQTRLYAETTDETGRKTRAYSDALGRTVATVAGLGAPEAATTQTAFDVLDRATRTTAPEGQATTYAYDPLGRLARAVSPDAGTLLAKYDAAGNARFRQDAREAAAGRVLYTEYDALNRPTETGVGPATWSALSGGAATPTTLRTGTTAVVARAYDAKPPASGLWNLFNFSSKISAFAQSNLKGRASGVVSRSGDGRQVELYSYDRNGRVAEKRIFTAASERSDIGGAADAHYSYAYDWQGRVTRTVRTVGANAFYQWYDYNATGQPLQVFASTSSSKPSAPDVTYTYNARGARASYQYTGGPTVPLTYTPRGWLSAIGSPSDFAGYPVSTYPFSESLNLADNGLVVGTQIYNATAYMSTRHWFAMEYDALGRLTRADYSKDLYQNGARPGYYASDAYDVSGVTYDRNGNILTLRRNKETGSAIDILSYTYSSGTNRLNVVGDAVGSTPEAWDAETGSFSYDANGNALAVGPTGVTLAYDAPEVAYYGWQNLPMSSSRAGVGTAYRYTPDGHRYWRQVNTTNLTEVEVLALDGAATVGVFGGTGALKEWNVLGAGGEVIGRQPAGGLAQYYHTDAVGSVRVVTRGTAVVEARDYDPWGLELPGRVKVTGTKTREGFTGHELDAETGMNYAGARYYMPALGRWTSTDPLNQYPSPYVYCGNNPVSCVDPDGMFGDYFGQDGTYLGTDGINDGKVYVAKTGSSTSSISNTLTAAGYESTAGSSARAGALVGRAQSMSVQLPNENVRQSMVDIHAKAPAFAEEGGEIWGNIDGAQILAQAVTGPVQDPAVGNASILTSNLRNPNEVMALGPSANLLATFHTHPSGTNGRYSFSQSPSDGAGLDMNTSPLRESLPLNRYVLSDKVYIYSPTAVMATFPISKFIKP